MSDVRQFFRRRSIRTALRGALGYVFGRQGHRRLHGWRLFYRLRMQSIIRSRRAVTRLTRVRDVRIWVDDESFPRIRKLISRAQHTVVIQMFIWKDDALGHSMAKTIVQVAERGVRVDITKEAIGDLFEFHQDFLATRGSSDPVWKRFWAHPNIRIHHARHNDHGKVFIIDDHILLLTGMNIADEYHGRWHDYLVELRGHRFVQQYLTESAPNPREPVQLVVNSESRKDIRGTLTQLLESARRSIVVEHTYVADLDVLEILSRKTNEDVRVTIILSAKVDFHYHANMQAMAKLRQTASKRHLTVLVYPEPMHGKIILVDRRRAFVGSANLLASSLDEMGEVDVLIQGRSRPAMRKIRETLRRHILGSRPVEHVPRLFGLGWWLALLRL
jgi:cardiolipin synthase